MDLHSELILQEYKNLSTTYIKMQNIIMNELKECVHGFGTIVNSVESRIKKSRRSRHG